MYFSEINIGTKSLLSHLLDGGADHAARAQVFAADASQMSFGRKPVEECIARSEQMTLQKRIRLLHGAGILFPFFFLHRSARKRCAAKAAAVGRFPNENNVVASFARFVGYVTADDFVFPGDAHRHRVYETVTVIGGVEDRIAPEIWNA